MATKYIINGELTEEAMMTTDLMKRCTFAIGPILPIRGGDDDAGDDKNKSAPSSNKMFFHRFIETSYPASGGSGGIRSNSMIIPDVVIHHELSDYFGKTAVSFGIPMWFVSELQPKLSSAGASPEFRDRKLSSNEKYWWTRCSLGPTRDGEEYIRIVDEDGEEEYFGDFPDFFASYPTSVIANVTCSIKMITDVPRSIDPREQQEPSKTNHWRAAMKLSMANIVDIIDIPAPQSSTSQKSISGKKDRMRAGLKKMRDNGSA